MDRLAGVLALRHGLVRSLAARPGPSGGQVRGGRVAQPFPSLGLRARGGAGGGTVLQHRGGGAGGLGRACAGGGARGGGGAGVQQVVGDKSGERRPDLSLGTPLVGGAARHDTRGIPWNAEGKLSPSRSSFKNVLIFTCFL